LIGGHFATPGSTISELRASVPALEEALAARRRELKSFLGEAVYRVVQALAEGVIPSAEIVRDGELGAALRKAVECGYKLQLEAPRENQ
jgi:hypothetical protein